MSAAEPTESGDSGFAPDEDFIEADQEASTEVGDDAVTEEYDTEEEAPEEVRCQAVMVAAGRRASGQTPLCCNSSPPMRPPQRSALPP